MSNTTPRIYPNQSVRIIGISTKTSLAQCGELAFEVNLLKPHKKSWTL